MNKTPKATGRHGQLNKALRLRRRALGQWQPQPPKVKGGVTRYELENEAWKEGL